MVICSVARPGPGDDWFGLCSVDAVYSCETKLYRAPGARGRGAEWYVVEALVDGLRMTLWVKKSDKPPLELLDMFESASKDHVARQVTVALDSVTKALESVAGGPLKTLALRCKVFEDEQEDAKSQLVVALHKRRERDEEAIEAVESGLSPFLVDDVGAVALLQEKLATAAKEREAIAHEMKRVKVVHERLLKVFADPIVVSESTTCEVCFSDYEKSQSTQCIKDGVAKHSLCPLCVQNTMVSARSPDPAHRRAVVACPMSLAGFSCCLELREVVPKLASCPNPSAAIAAAMRLESSHALLRSKTLAGKVEALCKGIVCECGFIFETFTAPGTCASVKCPQCLNYVCALCYQVAPGTGATQNTAAHMMSHVCPFNLEHGKQFHSDELKATMFKYRIMFQIVQELLPIAGKVAQVAKAREALEENAEQLAAVAAPSHLTPDDIMEILTAPHGTHIDNLPKSVRVEFQRLHEAAEGEGQWKPLSYSAESLAELSSAISHVDAGEIARDTCVHESKTARSGLRSLCCALRVILGPGADASTNEALDAFLEAAIPHFDTLDSVAEELDHAEKAVLSTTLLEEMYDEQFPEWSWDVPAPAEEHQKALNARMAEASALIATHSCAAFWKLKDIYKTVKPEQESTRAATVMQEVLRSLRAGEVTRMIEMQLAAFDEALCAETA